jgi:hypothetical protein
MLICVVAKTMMPCQRWHWQSVRHSRSPSRPHPPSPFRRSRILYMPASGCPCSGAPGIRPACGGRQEGREVSTWAGVCRALTKHPVGPPPGAPSNYRQVNPGIGSSAAPVDGLPRQRPARCGPPAPLPSAPPCTTTTPSSGRLSVKGSEWRNATSGSGPGPACSATQACFLGAGWPAATAAAAASAASSWLPRTQKAPQPRAVRMTCARARRRQGRRRQVRRRRRRRGSGCASRAAAASHPQPYAATHHFQPQPRVAPSQTPRHAAAPVPGRRAARRKRTRQRTCRG